MKKLSSILLLLMLCTTGKSQQGAKRFSLTHVTAQYAGSIGFGSVGIGCQPTDKTSLSIHYGFVPQRFGGQLHIAALKYTYTPFRLSSGRLAWHPVNPGLFLSYHFGDNYHLFWPREQYPAQYYWWPSALRLHPSLNSELSLLNKNGRPAISAYLEANTNDLYIASYFMNRESLKMHQIIKLGLGIRIFIK